jgi:hypothetical protein
VIDAERICHSEFLTPVRALDLAQLAIDDPAGRGHGLRPAPSARRKPFRARSRGIANHGWTPGPASGSRSCPSWCALLPASTPTHGTAARDTRPRDVSTATGTVLFRPAATGAMVNVWADDPDTGKRRHLTAEEDRAF